MKKTLLIGALAILFCGFAAAQQYTVLYNFGGPPNDGQTSVGNPIMDASGNLYGVTSYGGLHGCGTNGCGTIYELSPNGAGGWTETILYNFCSSANCADGAIPETGLVADASGNFYGTASGGGLACSLSPEGCGVFYELSPPQVQGGSWSYSVLYSFCSVRKGSYCTDGAAPTGPITVDSAGNFYGTTIFGGASVGEHGQGTVYQLKQNAGAWKENVLYKFCASFNGQYCPDGQQPSSGVVIGKVNSLYGSLPLGGSSSNGGLVYKLTPSSGGMIETSLFTFTSQKAYNAGAPVSLDPRGNVYTTFTSGGTGGTGGILRISASGTPDFYYFANQSNGANPYTGLLLDPTLDLGYGLTSRGGTGNNQGTVYQITSSGQETLLYSFCQQSQCTDGAYPNGLSVMPSGTMYGATVYGGANGDGVVFEITP